MSAHVIEVMGTAVSVDLRCPLEASEEWGVIDDLTHWFRWVDETFSTFRQESAISRLAAGEVTLEQCGRQVLEVADACERATVATSGIFNAAYAGPDSFDPTGLVKGWSVQRAADGLAERGLSDFCINGAGDLVVSGGAYPRHSWRVGVDDPRRDRGLLGVVTGRDFAMATSGATRDGTEIVDPRFGGSARGLLQATVVGPSLTDADAYATALVAAGGDAQDLALDLAADGWECVLLDAVKGVSVVCAAGAGRWVRLDERGR